MKPLGVVWPFILFSISALGSAVASDVLVCRGDGFVISLTSLGKVRLSENGKVCEMSEVNVSDHRRSTFSHLQILAVQRSCPGFESWMALLDVKIFLDDRKMGQVVGRIQPRNEKGGTSELTPTCSLLPLNQKKLDLFFSSKRG